MIAPGSEAAEGVSKEDMEKRVRGEKEKRTKLTNPNFFVYTPFIHLRLALSYLPLLRSRTLVCRFETSHLRWTKSG